MTLGLVLPAIIMRHFGYLDLGLAGSVGVLIVSGADVPGPVQRRMAGMSAALALNFIIAILVGYANQQPFLLGLLIALLCFGLTLIAIFGTWISAIGFAGMMVMVLSMDLHLSGTKIIINGLAMVGGGLFYMLLSILLFRMRPYIITQKALGDCIFSIGDYLKVRSNFYDENLDYEKTYKQLMQLQEDIHEKQDNLREMLFRSRSVTRQSTYTGRKLLVIFIESIDFFENATATIYNYASMHRHFSGPEILPRFQSMILKMVEELHEIGLAVQTGRRSRISKTLSDDMHELKIYFEEFIDHHRDPSNITPLINLRKVMQALEDMTVRIYAMHHYTAPEKRQVKKYELSDNYDSFISPSNIDIKLLWENLSLKSNNFRHALRVSLASLTGYIVAHLLQLQNSYWVLLTILVILKPSYSLTKQRNYHRLLGTLTGAVLGIGVLLVIPGDTGRFFIMVLLILATYSFIRTNYFTSVIFMTAYVLIFFYLIRTGSFAEVLEARVIDTIIGSIIAFLATYILVPSWEKYQINNYIAEALDKAAHYLNTVAASFVSGEINDLNYRLARKDAFVAQSNLSGAFGRMMNEPKSKQGNIRKLYEFSVLIYTLNSHTVTLADFARKFAGKYQTDDFDNVAADIIDELVQAKNFFTNEAVVARSRTDITDELRMEMKELVEKRRLELRQGLMDTPTRTTLIEYKPIVDQFLLVSRIAGDLYKLSSEFEEKKTETREKAS